MNYKTITLRLLEQNPEIYDLLRQTRTLLPTLERYATELKQSHQRWMEELSPRGGSQIASEAMEFAVKELEDRLASDEPFSLNDAHIQLSQPE